MPGEDPPLPGQLHGHHRRHLRDVHQDERRAQLQGVGQLHSGYSDGTAWTADPLQGQANPNHCESGWLAAPCPWRAPRAALSQARVHRGPALVF